MRSDSLFIGKNMRAAVNASLGDHVPSFLNDAPKFLRTKTIPIEWAWVTVSPFDRHGYCTLGTSVDVALAACKTAKHVCVVENITMPRTHGRGVLHVREVTAIVKNDTPIHVVPLPLPLPKGSPPTVSEKIGSHIASLIGDGACLQMVILPCILFFFFPFIRVALLPSRASVRFLTQCFAVW